MKVRKREKETIKRARSPKYRCLLNRESFERTKHVKQEIREVKYRHLNKDESKKRDSVVFL